jgi:hypothetical protein
VAVRDIAPQKRGINHAVMSGISRTADASPLSLLIDNIFRKSFGNAIPVGISNSKIDHQAAYIAIGITYDL